MPSAAWVVALDDDVLLELLELLLAQPVSRTAAMSRHASAMPAKAFENERLVISAIWILSSVSVQTG